MTLLHDPVSFDKGVCPVCKRSDGVQRCEGNLRDLNTFYCEHHDHVTVWVGRRNDD